MQDYGLTDDEKMMLNLNGLLCVIYHFSWTELKDIPYNYRLYLAEVATEFITDLFHMKKKKDVINMIKGKLPKKEWLARMTKKNV